MEPCLEALSCRLVEKIGLWTHTEMVTITMKVIAGTPVGEFLGGAHLSWDLQGRVRDEETASPVRATECAHIPGVGK